MSTNNELLVGCNVSLGTLSSEILDRFNVMLSERVITGGPCGRDISEIVGGKYGGPQEDSWIVPTKSKDNDEIV